MVFLRLVHSVITHAPANRPSRSPEMSCSPEVTLPPTDTVLRMGFQRADNPIIMYKALPRTSPQALTPYQVCERAAIFEHHTHNCTHGHHHKHKTHTFWIKKKRCPSLGGGEALCVRVASFDAASASYCVCLHKCVQYAAMTIASATTTDYFQFSMLPSTTNP